VATRGFLIRFIDIGLIILFGFLMISDIEASSRVELAGSAEAEEETTEPDEEDPAFVVVEVAADGTFVVTAPDAGVAGRGVADSEALQSVLELLARRSESAGRETVVLIEPHPASAVQGTVDVMDVSDRLGLTKSLRMDIEIVPPTADSAGAFEDATTSAADSAADAVGSGSGGDR